MYLKFILTGTTFRILEQEGINLKNDFRACNGFSVSTRNVRHVPLQTILLRGTEKYIGYKATTHYCKLQILSALTELFNQDSKMPERGDMIEVGNTGCSRIFLAYIRGAHLPWVCVEETEDNTFESGASFSFASWRERKETKVDLVDLGYDVYSLGEKEKTVEIEI